MLRFICWSILASAWGCSGSNFDVAQTPDSSAESAPTDTGESEVEADSSVTTDTLLDSELLDTPSVDTGALPDTAVDSRDSGATIETSVDTAPLDTSVCSSITADMRDVYVNTSASPGGKGTIDCPFTTLAQAAAAPFSGTVDRVVHVKAGTYSEGSIVTIRGRETYLAEGGVAKWLSAHTAKCAPAGDTCAAIMEGAAVLDGFSIAGSTTAYGLVLNGAGSLPTIRNTTVQNATRDGIVVYGAGGNLGPATHSDGNGHSGIVMRGVGRLSITGLANGFDNNKGTGALVDGLPVVGAGIYMVSGQLFVDGGTTASANHTGILFDSAGASMLEQTVSQATVQDNRRAGIVVAKGWTKFVLRKSIVTRNALIGLELSYDASLTNLFDLGTSTGPGNNVFGGAVKNGRLGILLCGSPATAAQNAEGNKWSECPPVQQSIGNCSLLPGSYSDVAYLPNVAVGAGGANPVRAPSSSCTVGG